jgi:hypothetical protein
LPQVDWRHGTAIVTDAEWGKDDVFLSKQFTLRGGDGMPVETVVLWHIPTLPARKPDMGHPLTVILCPAETTLFDVVLCPKEFYLDMFYSPRDVEGAIGRERWREVLADKKTPVKKLRNLSGVFDVQGHTVTLRDWFGAFNCGLDAAIKSVGGDNPYKSLVTDLGHKKDDMGTFFEAFPDEALEYALGDTVYLAEVSVMKVKQVNNIIKGALGFDPGYTLDTFPRSSGSLVAKTFEQWLMAAYPDAYTALLSLSDSPDNKRWKELKALREDLLTGAVDLAAANKKLRGTGFLHGMAMGSIKAWGSHCHESTGLFNAVVMGGRCVNEEPYADPYKMRIQNVVDIDLSSCYGSALRDFDYPLGLPTVYGHKVDDVVITLGEFLKTWGDDLAPGLWTVSVEGMLSFQQDLIHSKYGLTTDKIAKTIHGENWTEADSNPGTRDDEASHIGGLFLLTRKELKNGIITDDVLKVLKAVCSNQEWKDFMGLKVVCAAFYPRSMEVSVELWSETMMNPRTRGYKKAAADTRSRSWCRVSLDGFIGGFISYRKDLKRQSIQKGDEADLMQNAVKLFINTTYGDLAAPFFPMGNTVLANNITAKARTGVWMLSKALLTVQSITDGGMFSYDRVAVLREVKNPGMAVMADRQALMKHRSIRLKPLGDGRDWFAYIQDGGEGSELDKVCLDHINTFWGRYGLSLPFAIECKYENTARRAVYWSASDYRIDDTVKGKTVVKCRGAKQGDHPKQLWLAHLADPDNVPVPPAFYGYTQLIGVSDWQKNPDRFGERLPGQEEDRTTVHRPYKWGQSFDTYDDYRRVEERIKKDTNRCQKIEAAFTAEDWKTYRTALAKDL